MTTDEAMAAARTAPNARRADRLLPHLAERIGARAAIDVVYGPR